MEKEQVSIFGDLDRPLNGMGKCDVCGTIHQVRHNITRMDDMFSGSGGYYPFPCKVGGCHGVVRIKDVSDFQILIDMVEEYERDN